MGGKPALLFGLDVIAKSQPNAKLSVLMHHELFHFYQESTTDFVASSLWIEDAVTVVAIRKDGPMMLNGQPSTGDLASALARSSPPIREQRVVQADADAPYGTVVDATLIAQRQGARVAFGVSTIPAPPMER